MPSSKITDYSALATVDLDADYMEIVDATDGLNKKVLPRKLIPLPLAGSWTYSSGVATVEFLNLDAYSQLVFFHRSLTMGVNGVPRLRVSTDNGSTWKTASGEYSYWNSAGTVTNDVGVFSPGTGWTAEAKSGGATIVGWNSAVPKLVTVTRTDFPEWSINISAACNALQIMPANGGNWTGGSMYLFGQ